MLVRHGPTSVLGCHAADLRSHLSGETGPSETPRCLVEWKGPGAQWSCHCCNRLNEETTRKCLTCGRSSAYCHDKRLPFFGNMVKAMRPEQAVVFLDERGFDANATNAENWTPTHLACTYGNAGVLKVLIERGALFEAQTKRGWRPLHFAAQGGHLECVNLLLDMGARASCTTKICRSTPLHGAADAGFDHVCRRLIDQGADHVIQDVAGRTALHLAADKNHLGVVQVLLQGGAKPDVLDHDGWNSRQVAEFRGYKDVAALLAKASLPEDNFGAKNGLATTLLPTRWHSDLFSQVRKDTARACKVHARSCARDRAYARYANIYKNYAAETYVRSIEMSRKGKAGRNSYRMRIVGQSTDANRYRGYHLQPDEDVQWDDVDEQSTAGMPEGASAAGSRARREAIVPQSADSSLRGEDEERKLPQQLTFLPARRQGSSPSNEFVSASVAAAAVSGVEHLPSATDGKGSNATFVDVVPFYNIRAKYLRPWGDTALSRPHHISAIPDRTMASPIRPISKDQSATPAVGPSVAADSTVGVGLGNSLSERRMLNAGSKGMAISATTRYLTKSSRKKMTERGAQNWGGV